MYKDYYKFDHSDIASCYNQIGNIYKEKNEFAKAKEYFTMALKVAISFYGEEHVEVGDCHSRLGDLCRN